MGFINYRNKREFESTEKLEIITNKIFNCISFELEFLGASVDINDNILSFSNKDYFTTHTGENMRNLFKIIREGKILVVKENTNIKIYYESNLTQHFFLSTSFGIIMCLLIGLLSNFDLQIIIKTFLILFIPSILIGFIITKVKMDSIIKKCIKSIKK